MFLGGYLAWHLQVVHDIDIIPTIAFALDRSLQVTKFK